MGGGTTLLLWLLLLVGGDDVFEEGFGGDDIFLSTCFSSFSRLFLMLLYRLDEEDHCKFLEIN